MKTTLDRQAKFERVLPRLRLARRVHPRSAAVTVLAEGLADRCDVLARLVDGLGRIHAETQVTLERGDGEIGLGQALNLPPGRYEVVLSPPRAEFHEGVPVERRLPLTLATERLAQAPERPGASLGGDVIDMQLERAGPVAALARMARGAPWQKDDAALAAVADAPAFAFAVLALAEESAAPEARAAAAATLRGIAGGEDLAACIAGTVAGLRDDAGARLRAAGLAGDAALETPEVLAGLVALAMARSDLADLVQAVLDRAALGLALRSGGGALVGPAEGPEASGISRFAALGYLLWGVGLPGCAGPETLALAAAGYDCPALVRAFALRTGPGGHVDDRRAVWRDGPVVLCAGGGRWQMRVGTDVALAGEGAARVGTGELVAEGPVPAICDHADETSVQDGRLGLRLGRVLVALSSGAPMSLENAASGIALDGGSGRYVLRVGAGDDLAAFVAEDGADPVPLTRPAPEIAAEGATVTLRLGGHALALDFSEGTP
ncbi:hypothetical protein P1J78_02680 [Psychromarinibacter sp. C21-152]|uniref:Uncharacterized protein n=1 Tax=Psychromarinibacter sediminicola TaxID=3033385 RepID=A0AAE3NKL4_9RHOB|nr:hypothetical protein [Psychromarinibacter sediminicola]MDF0599628.1 hypothetical protein [Psychromarinibacter sediminicola]